MIQCLGFNKNRKSSSNFPVQFTHKCYNVIERIRSIAQTLSEMFF